MFRLARAGCGSHYHAGPVCHRRVERQIVQNACLGAARAPFSPPRVLLAAPTARPRPPSPPGYYVPCGLALHPAFFLSATPTRLQAILSTWWVVTARKPLGCQREQQDNSTPLTKQSEPANTFAPAAQEKYAAKSSTQAHAAPEAAPPTSLTSLHTLKK